MYIIHLYEYIDLYVYYFHDIFYGQLPFKNVKFFFVLILCFIIQREFLYYVLLIFFFHFVFHHIISKEDIVNIVQLYMCMYVYTLGIHSLFLQLMNVIIFFIFLILKFLTYSHMWVHTYIRSYMYVNTFGLRFYENRKRKPSDNNNQLLDVFLVQFS